MAEGGLSHLSFIQVSLFLVGICSFRLPVCHGQKCILKARIHVRYHCLTFSNLVFLRVAQQKSRCIFTFSIRVLLTLFQCCLSIRFFSYFPFVFFPCHSVVSLSSCILHLFAGRLFFDVFGSPILSALFYHVSISCWSSVFRQNLMIYFLELY